MASEDPTVDSAISTPGNAKSFNGVIDASMGQSPDAQFDLALQELKSGLKTVYLCLNGTGTDQHAIPTANNVMRPSLTSRNDNKIC